MPIGTITNPQNWVNGTVVSPAWLQQVQDNINGWIAGTGPTFKSLEIDGTGGLSSALSAGNLKVSNGITVTTGGLVVNGGGAVITGNSTITGTLGTTGALTVQAGGATVTGNSSVTGTLAATSTVSGTIFTASTALSQTTYPTSVPTVGAVYKDLVPLAWGSFANGGSISMLRGFGIQNAVRNGMGDVTVTLSNSATNSNGVVPIACLTGGGGIIEAAIAGSNSVRVYTANLSNAPIDVAFSLVVFGG